MSDSEDSSRKSEDSSRKSEGSSQNSEGSSRDQLEKRLQILESKVQIQEMFHVQDTEDIIDNYIRHNVCSMISIGISVVSWASMAA
jgi:hypothetical protein